MFKVFVPHCKKLIDLTFLPSNQQSVDVFTPPQNLLKLLSMLAAQNAPTNKT